MPLSDLNAGHRCTLHAGGGELMITLEDNGSGLPAASPEDGDGLPNIRARLHEAGGECLVDSTAGVCTRVRLRLPFLPATSTP